MSPPYLLIVLLARDNREMSGGGPISSRPRCTEIESKSFGCLFRASLAFKNSVVVKLSRVGLRNL